jgi:RNA polymerase sporulation-specific sigma factor
LLPGFDFDKDGLTMTHIERSESSYEQISEPQPFSAEDISPIAECDPLGETLPTTELLASFLPGSEPFPETLLTYGTTPLESITVFDVAHVPHVTSTEDPTVADVPKRLPEPSLHLSRKAKATPEERVPLLSSTDRYLSEVRQIARLSPEEQDELSAQARNGSQQAKHTLIADCLWYVVYIARRYQVYVEHDDLLDLISVGNLAMTEKIDQALERATGHVTAYLCGVARRTISNYCLFRSRLIPVMRNAFPLDQAPQTESLDALNTYDDDNADLPIQVSTPEHTDPQELYLDKEAVIQALSQLTKKQQEIVALRHGLHDGSARLLVDIAIELGLSFATVQDRYKRAMQRLRKAFRVSA